MIPAIERFTVGGTTVLRADSPSGRTIAGLVFRVGRFDETLPTSGVTHLVEHLTLAGKPKASYNFNAEVSGRFTTFAMESSDPADVADFVTAVCGGLAADQSAVLDRETRILRTEAASRGGAGALGACLSERYGASGPGLVAYPEYGLRRLGWAEVADWRQRWFTAGNAVLWILGVVPDGLRVELPAASAPVAAPLRSLAIELPGFMVVGRGGIGMSLAGCRSVAATVTVDALQQRLTQVLRTELGLSYTVQAASEDLDARHMHTWLAADALPEQTAMTAHAMLTVIESLAEDGSADAETEDYSRRLREACQEPGGMAMVLHRQAQNILDALPTREPSQLLQAVSEVDKTAISEVASELLGEAMVAAPYAIPAVRGRMPQLPQWSAATISGTEYKAHASGATLTAGDQGVMVTTEEGKHVTVRADAVAALLRWSDDKRTLIGADGFVVQFDPGQWHDGAMALHAVDAHADPRIAVDLDEPGPQTPGKAQPTATQAAPPAPQRERTAWQRARSRLFRGLWIIVMAFGVLAIFGGAPGGGSFFVAIGAVGMAAQQILISRQTRARRARR